MRDVTVEITEVGSPGARREFTLPDGRKALEGRTLREWLDLFGGPLGQLDSPAGKVNVDLSQWLEHDHTTVLRIRVNFVDPKKLGTRPGSRRRRDSSG